MTRSQEKKDYILANIDKYVIDGRGNFYWEDAEEGMEYIYMDELEVLDKVEVMFDIGKRIYETKEDWGLDFIEDDIHRPTLLYKNKKDGRIMYAQNVWYIDSEGFSVGKSINDYKGTNKEKLNCLKIAGIITEEQQKILDKWHQETEQNIKESAEFLEKFQERERKFQEEQDLYKEQQQKKQALWEKKQQNQVTTLTESKDSQQTPNSFSKEKNNFFPPVKKNNSEVNIQAVANKTSMGEVCQETRQQIHQLLASKKLKTSDLPKEYQNWKEQLKNLSTEEEVINYVQNLQRIINKQTNSSNKHQLVSNGFSLPAKIGIGVGVSLLMIGLFSVLMIKRSKKKI